MDTKELNDRQHRKKRQIREARLEIVAQLYKRGYSVRKIAKEVQARMQLEKLPNPALIQGDIKKLLAEWREYRLDNIDERMQLELERIDECLIELWDAWEKSKEDYMEGWQKQKSVPVSVSDEKKNAQQAKDVQGKSVVVMAEQQQAKKRGRGDVAYIAEIRKQLEERRKLLGLYAPDKKEVTGADGAPIYPATAQSKITVDDLSEEELLTLYNIAAKRDKKEQ